jgi:ERCC4-type nuclease
VVLPPGLVVICDTREQQPLFSPCEWVVRKKLDVGDYSIVGMESMITVERKSLADLYGTIGQGYDRFERELKRAVTYRWKGLVIESEEGDIYNNADVYSSIHPNLVYQVLASLESHHWHVYAAKNRARARAWILSRFVKLYNHVRGGVDYAHG